MAGEQVDNIISKLNGTENNAGAGNKAGSNEVGQLLFCDAKSQQELNSFVESEKPKLVALVGFAEYGKSTFIGALYELFIQNQTYQGYAFVDSDTYVGFERRVFLRRHNDDNTSDTKRNILRENDILNLVLQAEDGSKRQIVISDKAGETYANYTSSDKEIMNDCVLEQADLTIYFVDAEVDSRKLAEHNQIIEKYESLLTRLKGLHKIGIDHTYIIVFTKADKVTGEDCKKKLADRREFVCEMFKAQLGAEPKKVFEVNSKKLDDEELNNVFELILSPLSIPESPKELDWVKMEIDSSM